MRCAISNPKKIRKLAALTGLDIRDAMTRGNTGHRIDIRIRGEERFQYSLFPDGTLIRYMPDELTEVERRNVQKTG